MAAPPVTTDSPADLRRRAREFEERLLAGFARRYEALHHLWAPGEGMFRFSPAKNPLEFSDQRLELKALMAGRGLFDKGILSEMPINRGAVAHIVATGRLLEFADGPRVTLALAVLSPLEWLATGGGVAAPTPTPVPAATPVGRAEIGRLLGRFAIPADDAAVLGVAAFQGFAPEVDPATAGGWLGESCTLYLVTGAGEVRGPGREAKGDGFYARLFAPFGPRDLARAAADVCRADRRLFPRGGFLEADRVAGEAGLEEAAVREGFALLAREDRELVVEELAGVTVLRRRRG
ncbi:MAG: hypothetical protein HY719_00660 [Planctomycetes bacterium]|nr:hypothetical protein [Planctomycetota bacterium]